MLEERPDSECTGWNCGVFTVKCDVNVRCEVGERLIREFRNGNASVGFQRPGETESDLPKSFRENRKFQIRNGVLFISLSLKSMLIILTSNTKQAHSSIPKFAD